jgi:hypothetical protein
LRRRGGQRRRLTGVLKGSGQGVYAGKAVFRGFCQGGQHDLLDGWRQRRNLIAERGRRNERVLDGYFLKRSGEGGRAGQPFVEDNPQRVLIAGRARLRLKMLRGHVSHGPRHLFQFCRLGAVRQQRDAKVAEQQPIVPPQQHIFWLHISMDQLLVMRML